MWTKNIIGKPVNEEFCDGCCYNNNDDPNLNCDKRKCCYLVKEECILHKDFDII